MNPGSTAPRVVALSQGLAAAEAIAAQAHPPDEVIRPSEPLSSAVREALGGVAEWIWVLDSTVVPRADGLAALLGALGDLPPGPPPVLLASVILSPEGAVAGENAARFRRVPVEPAMACAEHHLLPLRAATGSVLVHAGAARAGAPPRAWLSGAGALFEWTARLLRDQTGYLVAESECVSSVPVGNPLHCPRTAAAVVAGGGFSRVERLRLGLGLLRDLRPRAG